MPQEFKYLVDKRYLPLLLPFGLWPGRGGVTLTETSFIAKFGLLKLQTPLENIDDAHVTRDYRWWTAVGPRLSHADDGLTFGTNKSAGVCVHFREKVPSPLKRSGHSALTVTVSDVDGLASSLRALRQDPGSQ
jgi:hypothetical protein